MVLAPLTVRVACFGAGVGLVELALTRLARVGSVGATDPLEKLLAGRAFFLATGTPGTGGPGKVPGVPGKISIDGCVSDKHAVADAAVGKEMRETMKKNYQY